MYSQRVTVHYADGTETQTVLTQWSMGQFAQYSAKQGWAMDMQNPGLLGVVMLRYQAYAELHRDPTKARPAFDRWDMTVSEIEPQEDPKEETPTEAVPSGG